MLNKLRDILCYCGLSKEEYESIKKDIYINNFKVWKYLHTLMIVCYGFLLSSSLSNEGLSTPTISRLAVTIYAIVVAILFNSKLKEDSLIAQLIIYLSMIILMVSSLIASINYPEVVGVGIVSMLVFLPVFMIDKPYFMIIFLSLSTTIYLNIVDNFKNLSVYKYDLIYSIIACIIGIIINIFYGNIRTHEFIIQKNEKELINIQNRANEESTKLNIILKSMSESVVGLLGDVVESRDSESGQHIDRVKGFTYILANKVMNDLPEYGLDKYTVDLITFTSSLHDVGKIAIPDAILCKPGKLTKEEFDIMKRHCEKGAEIISKMSDKWSKEYIDMGISICLNHHEKWDGKGYPNGLKGDEIPIAAQIVSIADIYDALITERVYKNAYTHEQACDMIINGECGAYSSKLLNCFISCKDEFKQHAINPNGINISQGEYEIVSREHPDESFVIGLHDQDKTLRDKVRLDEEVSVLQTLSEQFFYVCCVDFANDKIERFKADPRIEKILNTFNKEVPSKFRYDMLLNQIIISDDYDEFRKATNRDVAMKVLQEVGHLSTDFRIRLEDGIHYARLKISLDPNNPNAVIEGIINRDDEHALEVKYMEAEQELEIARREKENLDKLADRLAVIDCISSEYDYVCSLNAKTMEVTVYRAEPWIRDMFKNLEDIVVSPVARDKTLQGIILPEDFDQFQEKSKHENVMKALMANGSYTVNYRAYKYGELVNYQTKYELDRNNPSRIIIGLHTVN